MNEKNLTHKLTKAENSKGGKKSAQRRKEQKTIRLILNEMLEQDARTNKNIGMLADKLGLESGKSIKEVLTLTCLLNTIKKGDMNELEKVANLLGENTQSETEGILEKLDSVLSEIDEEAKK